MEISDLRGQWALSLVKQLLWSVITATFISLMFENVTYIGHLEGSSIGKGIMTSKVGNGSSGVQRRQ